MNKYHSTLKGLKYNSPIVKKIVDWVIESSWIEKRKSRTG